MSTHEEEPIALESHEHDPTRPHSFDLTLELERQLEAESLPTSPSSKSEARPQSLDTHVLASLVTSLRVNVAELTKERDEQSAALEAARGRVSDLSLEVRQLKGAQAERDTELAALRQKIRDDEESIVLLRSKVEESRFDLSLLFDHATFLTMSCAKSRCHAIADRKSPHKSGWARRGLVCRLVACEFVLVWRPAVCQTDVVHSPHRIIGWTYAESQTNILRV
jgi:hypothetical protein